MIASETFRRTFVLANLLAASLYLAACGGGERADAAANDLESPAGVVGSRSSLVTGLPLTRIARPEPAPAPSAAYVTVVDGHLSRNGARLRQWGVNVQSGYFTTYAQIDSLIDRLKSLGFNALRLWPTAGTFYATAPDGSPVPATAVKGDGSALDRFDYLVYKAGASGMTLQMTMLHYIDLPTLKAVKDPAIVEWVAGARDDAELRRIHGFAPYVSEDYRQLLAKHIDTVLTRVNPYTGRSYSDEPAVSNWELANEARFVDCAVTPSCVQSLPAVAFQALSKQWQAATMNATRQPLPADMATFVAGPSYSGYARFVAERFVAASEQLRSHARAHGTAGRGVAVQPFIFNTGPISPNAVAHYAYSRGDTFSIGNYKSPLKENGAYDDSAWLPVAISGNLPSYLSNVKVEGKPMVVYETSFFRPYAYRAEFGPMMAAIALAQDWDGAFLYQYGQPNAIYSAEGRPEGYGTMPLPEPSASSPEAWKRDYTYGFHHGGDPVAMASWSVAARLFTSVQESAPLQKVWRMSLDDIFARPAGYPAGYFDASYAASKLGAVATQFVSDAKAACLPCTLSSAGPATYAVTWPTPDRPLLDIRSTGGHAVTGTLSGNLGELAPGVTARVVQPGFGVAAVLSEPGSANSTAMVVGDVRNSDMQFDRQLVAYAIPYGAIYGLTLQGRVPLVYSGPSVSFAFGSPAIFSPEDFTLRPVGPATKGSAIQISAARGTFRVGVSR